MAQGTGNGKGGTDEGKEKSRWRTSCIANEMSFEEADEPLAITIITAEGVFFFSSFFFPFFPFSSSPFSVLQYHYKVVEAIHVHLSANSDALP